MQRKIVIICGLCLNVFLTGCINIVGPNDPNFAPVFPDRPPEQTPDMGSIYFPKEGISLYEDIKARKVGDIITVVLTEKTNASKTSNSKYEKQSQETLANPTLFGSTMNPANSPNFDLPKQLPVPLQTGDNVGLGFNIQGDTKFTGTADAKQENKLIGTITVVVTKVYSNGNLHVRGEKWITINDGDEFVRVSGIVRNQDISPENQIDSNRIADARITYSGRGSFANSSKPGWIMKMLTSPWFPI